MDLHGLTAFVSWGCALLLTLWGHYILNTMLFILLCPLRGRILSLTSIGTGS